MENGCNKDLHVHLLKLMKSFHDVCISNNLTYYLVGGSQLGAVRHQGFIPWDDDMDVAMPRFDYDKLLSLSKNAWPENLLLNTPYKTEYWIAPFSKLVDKNTTLIEEGVAGFNKGGVSIDIFPLDGAGYNKFSARLKFLNFQIKRRLVLYKVKANKPKSLVEKILQKYLKSRPAIYFFEKMDKSMKKTKYSQSNIIGNYAGAWGFKEFMSKDIIGRPTLYTFEDYQFYGVENYDAYLSSLYGDYMVLPTKDKQVSHHKIIYLDLKRSYLDNKDGDISEK